MVRNKLPIPSEDAECFLLVKYLDILVNQKKILGYTHIPNETYIRSFAGRARRKALGMKPGFPDYIIFTVDKVILLEMKRTKGGVLSPEQKEWQYLFAQTDSCYPMVCYGFNQAKEFLAVLLT